MATSSQHHNPISNVIQQLAESSAQLNTASDALGTAVAAIDHSLREMNLGVTAHATTEGGWEHADGTFERHVLTYAKGEGGWCLRIVIVTGNVFDNESMTCESFRFHQAPREARSAAMNAVPELLHNLSKQAQLIAKEIQVNAPETVKIATSLKDWRMLKSGATDTPD